MVVGINGIGFVGYHLWAYLNYKSDVDVIRLSKEPNGHELIQCDVIVHMRERNRGDKTQLYSDNRESARSLLDKLDDVNHKPKIIYTSSIHEDEDNVYGKWRRDNITMFKERCNDFKSVKLPNIFGPFCKPNYNSFIATFCDKILKGKDVTYSTDSVNLLYVEDLCIQLLEVINGKRDEIKYTDTTTVESIYHKLNRWKDEYLTQNKIPYIDCDFDLNLFNTFRSYIDDDCRMFPIKYKRTDILFNYKT